MYKNFICSTIYNNKKGDNKLKNSKLIEYLTQWDTMHQKKKKEMRLIFK